MRPSIANSACFPVSSCSIKILNSWMRLPRWLRGIHFPTRCLCPIKCGSLQIWVSCSFMHCSYSEPWIQTCLSPISPPAACCPLQPHSCTEESSACAQTGEKGRFKNSTWQVFDEQHFFCCLSVWSKDRGHYLVSSKMESRSVIQRQRISTGANLQADLNARVNRADHMKLIYMHSLMRPERAKAGGLRVLFL